MSSTRPGDRLDRSAPQTRDLYRAAFADLAGLGFALAAGQSHEDVPMP
jgi:hypothetical protein